jgi:hypothetical protein
MHNAPVSAARPSPRDGGASLPQAVAQHVAIGGWVRRPLRLDARALERFGAVDVPDFVVTCTFDGAHGGARAMRGVVLRDLIVRAEPAFAERTDFKRVALVAESRDGYRALFSWAEIFHTFVGEGVYVAFDSRPRRLAPDAGPFALISLHDRFTGPRFVRSLASVDLHKLW